MYKFLLSLLLGCTVLQAQPGINLQAVRDIRLQNLKMDYAGSTIRFIIPGSTSVMGVLEDVTDKMYTAFSRSNFQQEIFEAYHDLILKPSLGSILYK